MRKTKTQKGITLVALIITIVVLLVLATVAISSIQNDGIISKAQDVANKFNEAQTNEKNMLDEYLSYFEGGSEVPDELERYVLGPNKTGRLATEIANIDMPTMQITSFIDEASTIPNASIAITIMGMSTNADSTKGILYIAYKGKKYEIVADLSTLYTESISYIGNSNSEAIFEGELALTAGTQTTIPITTEFTPARNYQLNVTINGNSEVLYTTAFNLLGFIAPVALIDDTIAIFLLGNQIGSHIEGCVLNAIYDIGASGTYVEENGFGAYYLENSDLWILNKTPNTSYIVPTTVAGETIDEVYMDLISGEPTFTYEVALITEGGSGVSSVKIISTNLDFWFQQWSLLGWRSVDLTECGDEIVFPDNVLSSTSGTIYVSSAVKANYADYDFIQVKQ